MPNTKDLRKRISTVKNTQQTTKAMKMVSAAKLRRAQDAIFNQRPYAREIGKLIWLLSAMPNVSFESPLIRRTEPRIDGQKKSALLVLVTSDRGLCGGFNGNIIKTALRWTQTNQSSYEEIEFAFVGKRGFDYFKTKPFKIGNYFSEAGGKVTFLKARKLADQLIELYLSKNFDEVKIVYNEFKNAILQKVQVEDFLPLHGGTADAPQEKSAAEELTINYTIKPNVTEVLQQLLNKNFAIQIYRILLESQAGEHGARMSAMENATHNAGEMIRKLTLQYNKSRQAGITKELLEIVAGTESQKGN